MSKNSPEFMPNARLEELRVNMQAKKQDYEKAVAAKDAATAHRLAGEFDTMMTEMHMLYPGFITSDIEYTYQLMAKDLNFRQHETPESDTEDKLNPIPVNFEEQVQSEVSKLNKKHLKPKINYDQRN